jgi:acetoin utilization deacetylase AcuC-like enzyme
MLDEQLADSGAVFSAPREATRDELSLNHATRYIDTIEGTSGKQDLSLDPDTSTSSGSWTAAKLAAGAVLDACDMLLDGRAANAVALVRPPGHHAEHDRAMGFCLFNNVAVGARYLLKKHGLERVMIYDWDIHHGNGTQHAFYDMSEVLYVSSHQYPYYPGTGALNETGSGAGAGHTVNIPLPGGQGDADYLLLIERVLAPLARAYKPQLIIVSAGYDIYEGDPLGTMDVTPSGFGAMTAMLKQLAEELCEGRLLLALEGGYHIAGIAQSIHHTINALLQNNVAGAQSSASAAVERIIQDVYAAHAQNWPVFNS